MYLKVKMYEMYNRASGMAPPPPPRMLHDATVRTVKMSTKRGKDQTMNFHAEADALSGYDSMRRQVPFVIRSLWFGGCPSGYLCWLAEVSWSLRRASGRTVSLCWGLLMGRWGWRWGDWPRASSLSRGPRSVDGPGCTKISLDSIDWSDYRTRSER